MSRRKSGFFEVPYTLNITGGLGCSLPAVGNYCPVDFSAPANVPADFMLTTAYDAGPPDQILLAMDDGPAISPPGVTIKTFPAGLEIASGTFTADNGILSANLIVHGFVQAYLALQSSNNSVSGIFGQDSTSGPSCATGSSGTQYYECTFFGDFTAEYVDTPEPASIGLLSIGLLGLMTARQRARRKTPR